MNGNYEEKILTAVDMLIQNAVSNLNYDKTVQATIYNVIDEGLGIYKVKYQDSIFTAIDQGNNKYSIGTLVYVLMPGNEVQKERFIIGTAEKIKKVGLSTASLEDRFVKIGTNLLRSYNEIGLASYRAGGDQDEISHLVRQEDINVYKNNQSYLMIAGDFRTALTKEQQSGNGDYGIVFEVEYEDSETENTYTQSYSLNVNNMIGQPYHYTNSTHQSAIFSGIDGNKFKTIKSIYAFCRNFPKEHEEPCEDDIFINNLEAYFVQPLTDEEMSGMSLRITTPLGSYWADGDSLDKILKAEIKLEGSILNDSSLGAAEFYWFKKDLSIRPIEDENGKISYPKGYSRLGGIGWKCLNETTAQSTSLDVEEDMSIYIAGGSTFTLHNNAIQVDCPSYETEFKCVAMLEDYTVSNTVIMVNQGALHNITIRSSESSNKISFANVFNIELAAELDGAALPGGYKCIWARSADNREIEVFDLTNSTVNVNPNAGNNTITYFVEILNSAGVSQGIGSITFTNIENQSQYILTLTDADAIYKYDINGVSPASSAKDLKDRIVPKAIGFSFRENSGREVLSSAAAANLTPFKIKWWWPAENTLINTEFRGILDTYNGLPYYYLNVVNDTQLKFPYSIENKFDYLKTVNTIYLEITYNGVTTTASSNLLFIKEGENGTNGTRFITKVVPQVSSTNLNYMYAQKDSSGNSFRFVENDRKNYKCSGLLKAEIYDAALLPVSAISSISWKMLPGNSTINISSNGQLSFSNNYYANRACIAQAGIQLNSSYQSNAKIYYGSYAIPFVNISSSGYTYIIEGGWREAVYDTSGSNCNYDNTQKFKLKKIAENTGNELPIDSFYWTVSWGDARFGINETEVEIEPPIRLITNSNNYIKVTIGNDYIIFPVHLHINQYSMSAMNDWDGNNLELKDNGILVAQIAAGKKNNDNTFTGVAIGETFETDSRNNEIGLFGYNEGTRTILLSALDGHARFGGSSSYLDILPDSGVVLQSGNYDITTKTGMKIDMSTPSITYGNGNFNIDREGKMTAKGGGNIAGWTISDNALYKNYSSWGNAKGMYFGDDGLSITNKFKVASNGNFDIGNGSIVYKDNKITFGNNVSLSWSQVTNQPTILDENTVTRITNNTISSAKISANQITTGILQSKDANHNVQFNLDTGTLTMKSGSINLGDKFTVNNNGELNATSGSIGGWTIGTDSLYKGSVYLRNSGQIEGATLTTSTNQGIYTKISALGMDIYQNNAVYASIFCSPRTYGAGIIIDAKQKPITMNCSNLLIGKEYVATISDLGNYATKDSLLSYALKTNYFSGTGTTTSAIFTGHQFKGTKSSEGDTSTREIASHKWCTDTFQKKTSDKRLKTKIQPLNDLSNFYLDLKPVSYYFKSELKEDLDTKHLHFGLVAQDVEESLIKNNILNTYLIQKQKVSKENIYAKVTQDDNYYQLNTHDLHALHIMMIQKQQKQIEVLQKEIEELKKEIKGDK